MSDSTDSESKDAEMESHISQQMRGRGSHFHVKVKNGTVTLSGIAEDFEEKRQIGTAVKMIGGIHKVINQMRVISTEESFDNYR